MAAAVLFGLAQSGGRYFYCDALGLMTYDPCVRASHEARPCPLERMQRQVPDCCERITLPSMPDGSGSREAMVPGAMVAAVLSGAAFAAADAGPLVGSIVGSSEREEKPPPKGSTLRAQSMVSLT